MKNLSTPSLFSLWTHGGLGKAEPFPKFDFLLSFEDALWRLLALRTLPGNTALLPSFFCTDVTKRLEERGFSIVHYPLDENLRFIPDAFVAAVKSNNPSLCVVYYPMGMRDSVPSIQWFRQQCGTECLIIEDCADCLLEPKQVSLQDENHVIIDSIRKRTPLQGARLWSKNSVAPENDVFSIYKIKCFILWLAYRLLCSLCAFNKSNFLDNIRWSLFGTHSDLIGSDPKGVGGFSFEAFILRFIKKKKVKDTCAALLPVFLTSLDITEVSNRISLVPIAQSDYREVRFPVLRGVKGSLTNLSAYLENKGFSTDTHFDDSPLGQEFDFLLLPFSIESTPDQLKSLANEISSFSRKNL